MDLDQEDPTKRLHRLIKKYVRFHVGGEIPKDWWRFAGCPCMQTDLKLESHDDGYGGTHSIRTKVPRVRADTPRTDPVIANEIMRTIDKISPRYVITRDIERLLFDDTLVEYFIAKLPLFDAVKPYQCVCNYKSFLKIYSATYLNDYNRIIMVKALVKRIPLFDRAETGDMLMRMFKIIGAANIVTLEKIAVRLMRKENFIDDRLLEAMVASGIRLTSMELFDSNILWRVENIEILKNLMNMGAGEKRKCLMRNAYLSRDPKIIRSIMTELGKLTRDESLFEGVCMAAAGIEISYSRDIQKCAVALGKFGSVLEEAVKIHPCKSCNNANNIPGLLEHMRDSSRQISGPLIESIKCEYVFNMLVDNGFRPCSLDVGYVVSDGELGVVVKFAEIMHIKPEGYEFRNFMSSIVTRRCSLDEKIFIMRTFIKHGLKLSLYGVHLLLTHSLELCPYVLREHFDVNTIEGDLNLLIKDPHEYSKKIITLLLDMGIDIDFKNARGEGIMYYVIHLDMMCDAGANPNVRNVDGITPLESFLGRVDEKYLRKLKVSMCDNLVLSYAAMLTEEQPYNGSEMLYNEFLELVSPL